MLRPVHRLARGVYEVRWRTVSADDGHTAQGSYSFGVRASVLGPAVSAAPGPLADGGWLRALLDAVFYGALILFCGGVFCGALLSGPGVGPGAWLLPDASRGEVGRRQWRTTLAIGGAAVLFSLVATLADAAHAGGGISGRALHDYFLSDFAGYARLAVPAMLLLSVALAARGAPRWASGPAVLALAAVAAGGHSSSARLSGIAFASRPRSSDRRVGVARGNRADRDRVGAAVARVGRRGPAADRRGRAAAVRHGRSAGVLHARGRGRAQRRDRARIAAGIVECRLRARAAGEDLTGRRGGAALLQARAAVATAAAGRAGSYDGRLERRHWRLLASEPIVGAGIVLAAALLLAYAPPIDPSEQVVAARSVASATVRDDLGARGRSCRSPGRPVRTSSTRS